MLSKKTISADGSEVVYYTEYPENSSPVTKVMVNGRNVESHSKTDSFGRKVFDEIRLGTGFVSRQFSYHAGKVTDEHKQNGKLKSSPTTSLVSQIVLSNGTTLSYAYDAEEHITSVTEMYEVDDIPVVKVTSYTYDALGRLETETSNGVTTKFEYDNYGNIVAKGIADENGDIIPETKIEYTYDEVWKDKLTSFNGQTITYGAQGNPTEYLGHNLTWEKGRQLKSFDNHIYTYRIKSPALQDKNILSDEDYYKVLSCYMSISYYSKIDREDEGNYSIKATALRLIIDDIRSKSQYSQKYEYVGSDGVYEREYTVGNENDSYYMPVTINYNVIDNGLELTLNNGVAEGLVELLIGWRIPHQYQFLFFDLTDGYTNLTDFLSKLAENAGYDEIGIILNLILFGSSISEMAVTDKVVKIQFSVGSGVYETKTVFDSNGNFKFQEHST